MKYRVNISIRIIIAFLLIITFVSVFENRAKLSSINIEVYGVLAALSLISDRFFHTGQKTENNGEKQDLTGHYLALAWFTALILPVCEYSFVPRDNLHISIIGVLLIITGTGIRGISIRALGKFFSRDVGTRQNQVVIKTGVYKYIRHPAYAGNMLQLLGFPLVLNAYFSLLMSLLTILIFLWRIRVEESFLAERLPGYRTYMGQTKKIIPKIW